LGLAASTSLVSASDNSACHNKCLDIFTACSKELDLVNSLDKLGCARTSAHCRDACRKSEGSAKKSLLGSSKWQPFTSHDEQHEGAVFLPEGKGLHRGE